MFAKTHARAHANKDSAARTTPATITGDVNQNPDYHEPSSRYRPEREKLTRMNPGTTAKQIHPQKRVNATQVVGKKGTDVIW
jgi:hypothetical protein